MKSFEIKALGLEELTSNEAKLRNGGFFEIAAMVGTLASYLIHLHNDQAEVQEMEALARRMFKEDYV